MIRDRVCMSGSQCGDAQGYGEKGRGRELVVGRV